ncbi:MAG TPA: TadE/TadG family type IV pilus assembly protein [Vicinamibacterales bacterium]|nr:TadE/TadG family type IV pilus assembly protein [Vicinamibacterales bacterium]
MTTRNSERGAAMIEAAIMTPILLLLMVGIFEVGRAYETWQVLTNAAREGARISVLPNSDVNTTEALVRQYMTNGQLSRAGDAPVGVDKNASLTVNGTTFGASLVTVDYPFQFMVLQPVAQMIVPGTTTGSAITMRATALMRNESP